MANVRERYTSRIGKRGAVVIPAKLRRRFGMDEGSLVIAEASGNGVLIRPAVALPVEIYSKERIAEFLLTNAADDEDYVSARDEVVKLGLDPDRIDHLRPSRS